MDLLILALAAGFILYKLFTTLGERTGFDGENLESKGETFGAAPQEKATTAASLEQLEPHLRRGVQEVTRLDPSFSLTDFQEGAEMAFEMIIEAYAKGDLKTLKNLLSKELYQVYEGAIKEREKNGFTFENTLVRIESTDVEKVELDGLIARIRIQFISEQVPVTKDKSGEIIDGNPDQIDQIQDYWTFEKSVRSKNPNWILVSTEV